MHRNVHRCAKMFADTCPLYARGVDTSAPFFLQHEMYVPCKFVIYAYVCFSPSSNYWFSNHTLRLKPSWRCRSGAWATGRVGVEGSLVFGGTGSLVKHWSDFRWFQLVPYCPPVPCAFPTRTPTRSSIREWKPWCNQDHLGN